MKELPLILKNARLKMGYSQQEIADLVNVAQRTYSMYETGERNPKHKTVVLLQNALEIPDLVQIAFPPSGQIEAKPVPTENFMEVPYLPASAQAGYAAGFADYTPALMNYDTILVPKEYEKGNYIVIEIIGDSMDDDTARSTSSLAL